MSKCFNTDSVFGTTSSGFRVVSLPIRSRRTPLATDDAESLDWN